MLFVLRESDTLRDLRRVNRDGCWFLGLSYAGAIGCLSTWLSQRAKSWEGCADHRIGDRSDKCCQEGLCLGIAPPVSENLHSISDTLIGDRGVIKRALDDRANLGAIEVRHVVIATTVGLVDARNDLIDSGFDREWVGATIEDVPPNTSDCEVLTTDPDGKDVLR